MICINVNTGGYEISFKRIEEAIVKTLKENNIFDALVDVAIVDKDKMDELNKKYYKDEVYEHPIFTFTENKTDDFVFPPDLKNYLGQIVILNDKEEVLVDLAKHGTLHLVGIHH